MYHSILGSRAGTQGYSRRPARLGRNRSQMPNRGLPYRRRVAAVSGFLLSLPLFLPIARAQPGPGFWTRPLTIPARPGTAVVRLNWRSEFLPAIKAIADAFPAKQQLDINYDDYASRDRFCEPDGPLHVLVEQGEPTPHDKQYWQWRFPAGTPQPETFLVGQLRVVFVVHKSNSIQSLDFTQIRKALNEERKTDPMAGHRRCCVVRH